MSDTKPENSIQTTVQVVAGIMEKIPIYGDLVKPTAEQLSQGMGNLLKAVMFPMTLLGYKIDDYLAKFQQSLDKKTAKIPPEKLQAPNPTVMGPIIQALGYTSHEDQLREMFTSLLASAMNSDKAQSAHPAFVEIIKQLVVDEAKILQFIGKQQNPYFLHSAVYVSGFGLSSSSIEKQFLVNHANCRNPEMGDNYIVNLMRLGLIRLEEVEGRDPSFFDDFVDKQIKDARPEMHMAIIAKAIVVTSFGYQFLDTCVIDK